MINRLFKWLFSFDRPIIRCKRPGCNRPLRTEQSRLLGYSYACWQKVGEEEKHDFQKNMEEIAKELQPK